MEQPRLYRVYKVYEPFGPASEDQLFVENDGNKTIGGGSSGGTFFRVKGDLDKDIKYEEVYLERGLDAVVDESRTEVLWLGYVWSYDWARTRSICAGVLLPTRHRSLFHPRREPLANAKEWTQEAIDRLRASGILFKPTAARRE